MKPKTDFPFDPILLFLIKVCVPCLFGVSMDYELMSELSNTYGVSGYEHDIAELMGKEIHWFSGPTSDILYLVQNREKIGEYNKDYW